MQVAAQIKHLDHRVIVDGDTVRLAVRDGGDLLFAMRVDVFLALGLW